MFLLRTTKDGLVLIPFRLRKPTGHSHPALRQNGGPASVKCTSCCATLMRGLVRTIFKRGTELAIEATSSGDPVLIVTGNNAV